MIFKNISLIYPGIHEYHSLLDIWHPISYTVVVKQFHSASVNVTYLTVVHFQWEKLKKHSEELNERAETAEYQIATISQEYRKLFQDKDSELRRLKTENENLKEQQKRLIPLDGSVTQSPLKELATQLQQKEFSFGGFDDVSGGGLGGTGGAMMVDGWGEEFHDFSDVVSSQSEINRLQSELGSLKVECQHWKTVAQEKVCDSRLLDHLQ